MKQALEDASKRADNRKGKLVSTFSSFDASKAQVPAIMQGNLFIPGKDLSLWYGGGGVGKTWLALDASIHIVTGRNFLNSEVRASKVLYLTFELGRETLQERVIELCKGHDISPKDLDGKLYIADYNGYLLPQVIGEIEELIAEINPALIVIDGYQSAFGGDPNDAKPITENFQMARSLSAVGRAVVMLDHVNKGNKLLGSVYKYNLSQVVYELADATSGRLKILSKPKSYKIDVLGFEFDRVDTEGIKHVLADISKRSDGRMPFNISNASDPTKRFDFKGLDKDAQEIVKAVVKNPNGMSKTEVCKAVARSQKQKADTVRKRLGRNGVWEGLQGDFINIVPQDDGKTELVFPIG